MTITHNPKLGLFIASVPRVEAREIDYAADGHAPDKGEPIAYSHRSQVKIQLVLAVGSKREDVEQRANLKLLQGA